MRKKTVREGEKKQKTAKERCQRKKAKTRGMKREMDK